MVGLNIKNERVHALARQAAQVTGLTQTGAIEEALVRLLAHYGHDPDAERARTKVDLVHRIVADFQATDDASGRHLGAIEELYDDLGLPR